MNKLLTIKNFIKFTIGYIFISVSIFLMLRICVQYTTFEDNIAFLKLKQEYTNNFIWKSAFYIHVFTSTFCLFAGLTQFSKTLINQVPKIHRTLGNIYFFNIVCINFPVCIIMSYYANGLLPSKIAFSTLNILWMWFTLKAILCIKKGKIVNHKKFMIRSFALTLSAISLRTWNILFVNFSNFDSLTIYMIIAWLGFVPNLIMAEIYIFINNLHVKNRE